VLSPSGIVTALIFCLVLSISICLFLINSRTTGFESAGVPGFAQEDGGSLAGTNSNSTPPETPLHEDDAAGKTVRSEAPGDIESETEKPASRKTRVPRKRSSATGQTSGNLSPGMREGDPAQIEGQAGTRSLGQAKKGAELSRVKSIYVDSFVGVRRGEVVRQEFEIEIERASLTAAKEPAKADAVLVGKTARGKGNRRQLQVRLINRAGEVLWSGSVPLAGADSDSAMRQAIQDLIRIIKDQQK
jgi:hypothetical protein